MTSFVYRNSNYCWPINMAHLLRPTIIYQFVIVTPQHILVDDSPSRNIFKNFLSVNEVFPFSLEKKVKKRQRTTNVKYKAHYVVSRITSFLVGFLKEKCFQQIKNQSLACTT